MKGKVIHTPPKSEQGVGREITEYHSSYMNRKELTEKVWELMKKIEDEGLDVMEFLYYSFSLRDEKLEELKELMERSYEKTRKNHRI